MVWVATAIVGGAVVGAVGSAIAGGKAANAARDAAGIQADAAKDAAAIQAGMYNQTRNDLLPYQNVGRGAIPYMNSLVPGGFGTSNPALPAQLGDDGHFIDPSKQTQTSGIPQFTDPTTGNMIDLSGLYGGAVTPPAAAPKQRFNGATGGLEDIPTPGAAPDNAMAPPGSPAAGVDTRRFGVPIEEGGTGLGGHFNLPAPSGSNPAPQIGPPGAASSDPNQSPFLSAVEQNIPQLGPQTQSAVQSFLPGTGDNPLQSSLYSFVNGSSSTPNPLLRAANNSILGASGTPNSALTNLMSFGDPTKNTSLGALNNLLGLGSQDPDARQKALEATPGYKFTLDQGLKAAQNGFAAQGLASSGAAMKGAAQFATGLADQTYQSQLNNYLTNYNSQFTNAYNTYNGTTTNALNAFGQQSNLAFNSYGQGFNNAFNANAQQFTNARAGYSDQTTNAYNLLALGGNAAAQTGTAGAKAAEGAGNYLTSGAAATAGGVVGSANALNNSITGITGAVGQLGMMYGMNPSMFGSGSGGGGNSLSVGGYSPAGPTGIYR